MTDEERMKLEVVPYYERRGLAAQGVAEEWLKATEKSINERLRTLNPAVRNITADNLNAFVAGNYQNLKAFEAREVRRGQMDALTFRLDNIASGISGSIVSQVGAERADFESNLADVEREHAEFTHDLDEKDALRKDADARRDVQLQALKENRTEQLAGHIDEACAQIESCEGLVDGGVELGLYDEIGAATRKQKAARFAYSGVIEALADGGYFDEAEGFIAALLDDKGVSAIGRRYGFTQNDVDDLRKSATRAREQFELRQNRAVKESYDKLEADFADNNDSRTWVGTLRDWASDPRLKKVDPERAARYAKWADDLANARYGKGVKYKPDTKQLTEDVARAIVRLEMLTNPDVGDPSMSDDDRRRAIGDLQSAIAQKLRLGFMNNAFAPEQYDKLHNRFRKQLDAEQQMAMRRFYAAFGVNTSMLRLDDKGALTAGDAKSLTGLEFYAPSASGEQEGDALDATKFVELSDRFINTLDLLGESVDRMGAVDAAIRRIKTDWLKTGEDKRLELATKALIDYQRDLLTSKE